MYVSKAGIAGERTGLETDEVTLSRFLRTVPV